MLLSVARKIRSWDNALWQYQDPNLIKPGMVHLKKDFPFLKHNTEQLDPRARAALGNSNQAEQQESLFISEEPLQIEPSRGWAITSSGKLLWESIPFSRVDRPPRPWFFRHRLVPQKIQPLDAVVSSRYWMHNYFHFFNDFLGSLSLLERLGVPDNIPILVPRSVHDGSLFQTALKRSRRLARRPIVVHEPDEIILSKKSWFPKVIPNRRVLFDEVLNDLGITSPENNPGRKIFIARKPGKVRNLRNAETIQGIARAGGFEIVEPGSLVQTEQERIFSEARQVIGVHGAGLTNIVFRRNLPLSVLEIFPENLIPPHYFWLAREYGFDYETLVAGPERGGAFELNPAAFKAKVERLADLH